MARFIFIYKGPATDMKDMTEEQGKAVLEGWKRWMQRTGTALLDIGQPMANGISLLDNGKTGSAELLNGYSIVAADNINAARKLADGHPFLSEGKGNFAIDIYELLPVPM